MNLEFYIVNDTDRPDARHVAQVVNKKGELEYLHPDLRNWGKLYRDVSQQCSLELFGFKIEIEKDIVTFTKFRGSACSYADGRPRQWQGETKFTLQIKPMEADPE